MIRIENLHLQDGWIDSLRLFHQIRDQRWVLRLWSADVNITGNSTPIFVGTIEEQQRRYFTGLIFAARDTGKYDSSLDVLKEVLNDRFAVKPVNRIQHDSENPHLHWKGRVLLVWEEAELRSNLKAGYCPGYCGCSAGPASCRQ